MWLRDDGPNGEALEWRLHPVAGFQRPPGASHHDLLAAVVYALRVGEAPPAPPANLWDGLEAFPCYGDEVEPARLAGACSEALGIAPDAYGVVDHTPAADAWERSRGGVSVIDLLLEQLHG